MPVKLPRKSRLVLAAVAAALVAGCGTFDDVSRTMTGALTPHKIEIVQGNFISKEQVEALQPRMSRQQVREILGTPLVTSLFHDNRWDYVFTLKRPGVEPQRRKLTVWFQGEGFERVEGDPMPSEAEFVATLDNRRKGGKVPPLQATEEQLQKAASKPAATAAAQAAPPAAPPARVYPPLESPAR